MGRLVVLGGRGKSVVGVEEGREGGRKGKGEGLGKGRDGTGLVGVGSRRERGPGKCEPVSAGAAQAARVLVGLARAWI